MARTETIKDSAYRPIAILTYEDNGDIKVQDWQSRMIVGYYRKSATLPPIFTAELSPAATPLVC